MIALTPEEQEKIDAIMAMLEKADIYVTLELIRRLKRSIGE